MAQQQQQLQQRGRWQELQVQLLMRQRLVVVQPSRVSCLSAMTTSWKIWGPLWMG